MRAWLECTTHVTRGADGFLCTISFLNVNIGNGDVVGDIELVIPYSNPAVQCSLSVVSLVHTPSTYYFSSLVHDSTCLVQHVQNPMYESSLYEDTFTAV